MKEGADGEWDRSGEKGGEWGVKDPQMVASMTREQGTKEDRMS